MAQEVKKKNDVTDKEEIVDDSRAQGGFHHFVWHKLAVIVLRLLVRVSMNN
jgi:hypothetical protein